MWPDGAFFQNKMAGMKASFSSTPKCTTQSISKDLQVTYFKNVNHLAYAIHRKKNDGSHSF